MTTSRLVLISNLALATATLVAGCSKSSGTNATVDAPGGGSADAGTTLPPPTNGFQLISPDINIPAGEEHTYCWYFQTSNTTAATINKWQSHMTTGSHHLIIYMTGSQVKAPGTVVEDCGQGQGDVWTYSAQNEDVTLALPADDGAGKPIAMNIPAGQYGYIQMHYVNKGDVDVKAHVEVNADGLAAGTAFTPTAAFITYVGGFTVPKTADTEQNAYTVTNTCAPAAGRKFWTMSTHAHKQSIETKVVDNSNSATPVFQSMDWEHPGQVMWDPTFYAFASSFTNSCKYVNTTGADIHEGPSAVHNEMCMAVGYQFPATRPSFCLNGNVINL